MQVFPELSGVKSGLYRAVPWLSLVSAICRRECVDETVLTAANFFETQFFEGVSCFRNAAWTMQYAMLGIEKQFQAVAHTRRPVSIHFVV